VNQYVGDSYLETDSDTVTFTAGLHVGAEVKFTTAIQTTTGAVDASAVGYFPPFTGSVATNVEDKLAQYVSVKDFGAVGDGVTDDTAAIQAAINYAIGGNSKLVFAPGTYVTTGNTVTPYTNNTLEICGDGAVIKIGANQTGLDLTDVQNVTITGLTFLSTAISGGSQSGIRVTSSSRVVIKDCRFSTLFYGVNFVSTDVGLVTGPYPIPSQINNCVMKGCGAGVYLATLAEYVVVSGCNITDCTFYGITVDAGNCTVIGNSVNGNVIGIQFDGATSTNGDHGAIVGNTVNHNDKCGIWIKSLDYSMLVTGNNVWAQIGANLGVAPYDAPYGIVLQNAKNVNLVANVLGNNIRNLGFDTVTTSIVSNNTFIADSSRTTYNIQAITALGGGYSNVISGNTFEGTLLAGADNNDPSKYITPTLSNSWVTFGGAFGAVRYWKDGNGTVHLTGIMKDGTINATAFTLPVGFRPAGTALYPVMSNDALGRLQIDSAGVVTPKAGSNAYFSLDGVTFRAEA